MTPTIGFPTCARHGFRQVRRFSRPFWSDCDLATGQKLQHSLRFILSSSSHLPETLRTELETTLGVPVLEFYGLSEAGVMAANPAPPARRKPGTAGLVARNELAIRSHDGDPAPVGEVGEIAVHGPSVTPGYINDIDGSVTKFRDGWLATGDLGFIDSDGFLTITGRTKELINRGGEKVSPYEIEKALLLHPSVSEAAAFPVPHSRLGEDVAAAAVLRPAADATPAELREFLCGHLAAFKIPRRFVFVDDIPKGPTGKIQRYKLAAALGLDEVVDTLRSANHVGDRPPTPLEAKLRDLWAKTLGLESVGLYDNFFLLGGDSLQGVELLTLIHEALGYLLPQSVLIAGTITEMAAYIEDKGPSACVVPIQPKGTRPPFFCVHGLSGQVLNLRNLARHMGNDQPFYGIQSVEQTASESHSRESRTWPPITYGRFANISR